MFEHDVIAIRDSGASSASSHAKNVWIRRGEAELRRDDSICLEVLNGCPVDFEGQVDDMIRPVVGALRLLFLGVAMEARFRRFKTRTVVERRAYDTCSRYLAFFHGGGRPL
jgi:hypothetical protein